jgi:hypothetical protein
MAPSTVSVLTCTFPAACLRAKSTGTPRNHGYRTELSISARGPPRAIASFAATAASAKLSSSRLVGVAIAAGAVSSPSRSRG